MVLSNVAVTSFFFVAEAYRSTSSDESIKILANYLSKESSQANVNTWLDVCNKLFIKVENSLSRTHTKYSVETIERLLQLSVKAIQMDNTFSLDSILNIAKATNPYEIKSYRSILQSKEVYVAQGLFAELEIYVMTLYILQFQKDPQDTDRMNICRHVDGLISAMHRDHLSFPDVWAEKPQIVVALCRTLDLYSTEAQEYTLYGLTRLVNQLGTRLSLELFHELSDMARKYEYNDLRAELEKL